MDKKNYNYINLTGSGSLQPVRPVHLNGQTGAQRPTPTTGQTGPLTDQTGLNKTEGCTLCPQVYDPSQPYPKGLSPRPATPLHCGR